MVAPHDRFGVPDDIDVDELAQEVARRRSRREVLAAAMGLSYVAPSIVAHPIVAGALAAAAPGTPPPHGHGGHP